MRRKSSQIRKMLPKSPHKAVQVLKHLWDIVYKSPRKCVIMDEMWSKEKDKKLSKYMYMVGKFRNRKNESKLTQTVNKIKRQYKSLRSACRSTDIQWSQFYRYTKLYKLTLHNRKYIRKLETNDIESIRNFFRSDDSSFPLPDKKYTGKRFMKRSVWKSWNMYNLLESTTRKISLSTFRKYRPKNIKLQGKIPFRQSCCEVCQNFEFVMDQASKYLNGVPRNVDNCIDSSLCEYNSYFPKLDCVLRNCDECGTEKLQEHLSRLNSNKLEDPRECFLIKQWANKKERIPGTEKYRTYMHWNHVGLTFRELLDTYVEMLEDMSSHSFFASWNFHQYLVCRNNIEKVQVIVVHDYAQNYLCVHQHEVQALHWSHERVTLHPSCITY